MTCESESGRQEGPALKNEEVMGEALQEAMKCQLCGGPVALGPKLHYMRVEGGRLKDRRVCPVCFLKIVVGVKA